MQRKNINNEILILSSHLNPPFWYQYKDYILTFAPYSSSRKTAPLLAFEDLLDTISDMDIINSRGLFPIASIVMIYLKN